MEVPVKITTIIGVCMVSRSSRFTDNPLRLPGLTNEQMEWLEKRNLPVKICREADDSTLAGEIDLFWNKDDEEHARAAQ